MHLTAHVGTYGCTKEACQFRDAIAEKDTFKAGSAQIIGISPDPVKKQKQFVDKEKLTVSAIVLSAEGRVTYRFNQSTLS